ncbi:MAG TPA: galactokinase [Bacteroidales bacterium]|nr:galactokinase [Bacteroidales bacterium]
MKLSQLREEFFRIFDNRTDEPVIFFSPGRVNLIGEHTDYNNGFVFPCALNYGTYLVIRKRNDNQLLMNTLNFDFSDIQNIDNINKNISGEWVNYPLGIISEFFDRKIQLGGMEMLFSGDIPNGAGLSSSASIEMVTAYALNILYDAGLSNLELVKISQHAENSFVGMNCGIMDQFAVGMGEKDKAIFLNCDTLNYHTVPLELNHYQLIISNTNKRRGLTDSKYNERRSECEKAVEYINKKESIKHLSQLSIQDLHLLDELIPDEIIRKRARHVITENNRVLQAVKILENGDIPQFGKLMNESHDSLKDDYEVTGKELDALAYEARKIEGTVGSRMTGAGFGGCTVSIVHENYVDSFIEKLGKAYTSITGLKADFYKPDIEDGVRQI